MTKHRYPISNDYSLRLQEVEAERRARLPEPKGPRYPFLTESPDTEGDHVVALTWPEDTGWRHH